jgi:hypothetical protein
LANAEVDEVGDAEPLDDGEGERRRRDHGAEADGEDDELGPEAEDQPESREAATREAVVERCAHHGDRTRPG